MTKLTDAIDHRDTNNAAAVASVTALAHIIARVKGMMSKPWPKAAGAQPTDAQLMLAALFCKSGFSGGAGAEAGFHALQMRPEGCSVFQHGVAFNCGPAHNHTRLDLVAPGYFVRGGGGRVPFTLSITDKGVKRLAELTSRMATAQANTQTEPPANAKPVKAKAKKAKAKPAPVAEPVVEPVVGQGFVTQADNVLAATDDAPPNM